MNGTPKFLERFEVFKMVLPEKGPHKKLLKLNTFFLKLFLGMFMGSGMSYFALCVQNVVFLILGPLAVDFELPS